MPDVIDQSFQIVASQGSDVVSASVLISGDQKIFSDAIAVGIGVSVDYLIGVDVDNVKSYVILSDQIVTLTTTNSTGVSDVIGVKAGEPIFWHNKMQLANHFVNKNPWTKWAFSGATVAATVKVFLVVDATP